MIARKFAPALFSLILSGLMSLLVSGISTFRVGGLTADFTGLWIGAWLTAWLFAFPVVLVVAPLAKMAVEALTANPQAASQRHIPEGVAKRHNPDRSTSASGPAVK